MTALKKYARLECLGLWRETPEAQRRDVVVNFGEASLILSDPRTETALTHWSLPAILRLNAGETPALYAPGEDAAESLELDDPEMIEALETVHSALESARPHPGRLRTVITAGLVAGLGALAVFWLPGTLMSHTASVLPTATREHIGALALNDLTRLTGAPCADPSGQRALARFATAVFGANPPRLAVVPDGPVMALHLPGRLIVMHRSLFEDHDGPEVAAGYALAASLRGGAADPMLPLLDHAGVRATLGLLTSGEFDGTSLAHYGERLLKEPLAPVADADLLAAFAAASLSSSPYAYALDKSGETTLGLIEADPFPNGTERPALSDGDWISLRAICAD